MPTNATPAVMSAIVDNPPEALKPRYGGTVQFGTAIPTSYWACAQPALTTNSETKKNPLSNVRRMADLLLR
jgi:hypothetical protein